MTHVEMVEAHRRVDGTNSLPANNLERIWRHDRAGANHAGGAGCLENWDGVSDGPTENCETRDLQLRLQVQTFPRRRVELNLLLPARSDGGVETVDVLDEAEEVTAAAVEEPLLGG